MIPYILNTRGGVIMDFFVSQPPSIGRKKKYHRYQANQKPSSTHPLAKCSSRSFILSSLYIILYTTILKVPNKKMVYMHGYY
jgi:hypothetical protein